MKRIKKFLRLKSENKLFVLELAFFLFFARISIIILSPKYLKIILGKHKQNDEAQNVDFQMLNKISYYINKVSKYMPVKSNCLPQAIAAKIMLKRRKINSTLYIGMGKDKKNNSLIAHAWLKVGETPVTGGKNNAEYSEVAYFG
ncbi:MAG: lasso peptide biosynthesis B2 protein [Pseudomonadota bacterium]